MCRGFVHLFIETVDKIENETINKKRRQILKLSRVKTLANVQTIIYIFYRFNGLADDYRHIIVYFDGLLNDLNYKFRMPFIFTIDVVLFIN